MVSIISKSLMISTESKPTRNEGLKANNPILSGTISQTLLNPSLERFSEDDYEFLKFHGIYQQDNSLVIGMAASLLTCGTVTALTIVYRVRRLRKGSAATA